MGPKQYAISLDGTNPVFLPLQAMRTLEVIPSGVVTIQMRLGDGNDDTPLQNGASYVSPSGIDLPAMRLRLMAASATTATVIAWTA